MEPRSALAPGAHGQEEAILRIVAEHAGTASPLTREVLLEDLDLDSFDLIELAQTLDDELAIAVNPADVRGAVTIGDVLDVAKVRES
jgi:acyl carrier protein